MVNWRVLPIFYNIIVIITNRIEIIEISSVKPIITIWNLISNRIEIITNIIEINVIYRGEVVSNSNGCINPRDYIDFNYICNDFNSICNLSVKPIIWFQIELKSLQI